MDDELKAKLKRAVEFYRQMELKKCGGDTDFAQGQGNAFGIVAEHLEDLFELTKEDNQ